MDLFDELDLELLVFADLSALVVLSSLQEHLVLLLQLLVFLLDVDGEVVLLQVFSFSFTFYAF